MANYARGRNEVVVGLLAVGAAAVFFLAFALFTDRGIAEHRSVIHIELPTAQKLKKGDNVLFRGVPVGQVRSLDFAPNGAVVVKARLRRQVPLGTDATARLVGIGVFGDQVIVLEAGSAVARPLASGDTIPGLIGGGLADRLEILGGQAERLLADTTLALAQHALGAAAGAGTEIQELARVAGSLLGDQAAQLDRVVSNSAELAGALSRVAGDAALQGTVVNLERATAEMAEATRNMADASRSLASIMAKIDAGDGTVGRLVNDPSLYERAAVVIGNADNLLLDLRENPRRYVNVRIF